MNSRSESDTFTRRQGKWISLMKTFRLHIVVIEPPQYT